ncbi:MAG: hypothetical protein J6S67_25535 [Methanobrevibacter sp.]|nr:hypothetical protein [Methanobrevibacter sp.]
MTYELNIYGNNDEILKTYGTDKIRWGVLMEALKLKDELDKDKDGQFEVINTFLKKIFPDITDEDLANADYEDVINTFVQICNKAGSINGGETKNAKGAETE